MDNLSNLAPLGVAPPITADAQLDELIRRLAESRGYRRQPCPTNLSQLIYVTQTYRLQPKAAVAYDCLRDRIEAAGHHVQLRSAYRDHYEQQQLFVDRLAGRHDEASIQDTLATCAPPGYSKHHTGYTIDIAEWPEFDRFAETDLYAFLAHDDFAVLQSCAWMPSYPAGSPPQGPEPEAWEFVYCGA